MVGSPTHPVIPDLVMLWKMSPLRGGVRAGARLWARGPASRGWVAIGPKPKPRGAGGAPGPLRGEGRRPAQGYFLSLIISRLESFNRPLQRQLNPIVVLPPSPGSLGRQIGGWCTSERQPANAV